MKDAKETAETVELMAGLRHCTLQAHPEPIDSCGDEHCQRAVSLVAQLRADGLPPQPDGQPTYGLVRGALNLIEKAGIGWCYQAAEKPDKMTREAFGRWKGAVEILKAVADAMEGRTNRLERLAREPHQFLRP